MKIARTNIEDRLKRKRDKAMGKQSIEAVYALLQADNKHEAAIEKALADEQPKLQHHFALDQLATEAIFHESHIEAICVNYRLRFLPSSYF